MAKKVIYEHGGITWYPNEPEDYLLCDAIDAVERFAGTDPRWSKMKSFYFDQGKGINDSGLIALNDHLKRKGRAPIVLKSTHSDSHSLLSGATKSEIRGAILQQLQAMEPAQRQIVLDHKRMLIALQPERDPVQDAMRAVRMTPGSTVLGEKLAAALPPTLPAKGVAPMPIHVAKPLPVDPVVAQDPPPDAPAIKPVNANTGTVWVHRDGERRRVPQADVEQRLAEGWIRGKGATASRAQAASEPETDQPAADPAGDMDRVWSEIAHLREENERHRIEGDWARAEIERLSAEVDRLYGGGSRRRRGSMMRRLIPMEMPTTPQPPDRSLGLPAQTIGLPAQTIVGRASWR